MPEGSPENVKRRAKKARLRAGELCPFCQEQRLDYDGQINLVCPKCGIVVGGCFT